MRWPGASGSISTARMTNKRWSVRRSPALCDVFFRVHSQCLSPPPLTFPLDGMKAFLAYAILVIGIPNYIGVIAGAVFMPLAWPFSYPARLSVVQLLNFPKGSFQFCWHGECSTIRSPGHWAILAISVVWISIYYLSFKQPKLGWVSFIAGLVVGWLLSPV